MYAVSGNGAVVSADGKSVSLVFFSVLSHGVVRGQRSGGRGAGAWEKEEGRKERCSILQVKITEV